MLDAAEKRKRKEEIRAFLLQARTEQDDVDYDAFLQRSENIRQSDAVVDILASRRLPFLTKVEEEPLSNLKTRSVGTLEAATVKSSRSGKMSSDRSGTSGSQNSRLPPLNTTRQARDESTVRRYPLPLPKLHSLMTDHSRAVIALHQAKTTDAKLQHCLELLNKVKNDLDPSLLYFEAGVVFYEMGVYERAVVCLEKAARMGSPERIVDTVMLPNDVNFRRKVERMSPLVLPKFLSDRAAHRSRLVFEESERQRLRARAAHSELARLYSLVDSVQNLWKAHIHLQGAFTRCRTAEEHYQSLVYFHVLLTVLSVDILREGSEFPIHQQIIRQSAGPLSDAHVEILMELEQLEPENPVYQDWLGKRHTEKCQFDEAEAHYKRARNIRKVKPDREETLKLWRKKPQQHSEANQEMQAEIFANINKRVLHCYKNFSGDVQGLADEEATRDLSWFPGMHMESETILYVPPKQGWTGQT